MFVELVLIVIDDARKTLAVHLFNFDSPSPVRKMPRRISSLAVPPTVKNVVISIQFLSVVYGKTSSSDSPHVRTLRFAHVCTFVHMGSSYGTACTTHEWSNPGTELKAAIGVARGFSVQMMKDNEDQMANHKDLRNRHPGI